jgi:hypothetical protein
MDKLALNDKLDIAGAAKDAARAIAEEIGRGVAFYIETQYPEAVAAASSTFLLSVKNTTINQIMALKEHDKFYANIGEWIKANDKHRRTIRKLKKAESVAEVQEIMEQR